MSYDFKNLGAVDTVDEIQQSDTVLVERGGKIYRVAGDQVGGGKGLVVTVDASEIVVDDGIYITKKIDGLWEAYCSGTPVVIGYPLSLLQEDASGTVFATLCGLLDGAGLGEDSAGLYMGGLWFVEGLAPVYFTNGNPLPTAETSSLNLLSGEKSVEASNGES